MDRNSLSNSVTDKQKAEIKNWWHSFKTKESEIIRSFHENYNGDLNLVEWMGDNLHKIDGRIMWEYGPGLHKKHRLVLTPESRTDLRPLVRYILSQAPEFNSWEFYQYRLPEEMKLAELIIQGRTGWKDISDISFQFSPGEHNKIDITFFVPHNGSGNDLLGKAFVLTETLLGEEILDKWVGGVRVKKKAKLKLIGKLLGVDDPKNSVANLKREFDAKLQEIKKSLTSYCKLLNSKNGTWTVYKFEPAEQKDYAGKDDLLVAKSIDKKLFSSLIEEKASFYSERFSINEIFLYVKFDNTTDDTNKILEDRYFTEEAIDSALETKNIGCIVSGGTGKKYSYIDLAVTDLATAVQTIRDVFHQRKLTKRSWILFSDADLQAEWIGIWDDSPRPYVNEKDF